MKSILFATLSASILALQQCAPHREQPPVSPIQSASSTITWVKDKDISYPVTDNTTFLYLDNFQMGHYQVIGITLQQRVVTIQRPEVESYETHITVTGSPSQGAPWTIKRDARDGVIFDRFYRTTEGGCCGANIRYTYFDLLTGQRRFSATRPIARIDVNDTTAGCCMLTRYFAVDRLSEPGDSTFVAKLQYGSQDSEPRVTYLVFAPGNEDMAPAYVDVAFLQKGKLIPSVRSVDNASFDDSPYPIPLEIFPEGYPKNPPPSAKTLTDFSFVLRIGKNQHVTIPVIADHLAIDKATLPHGFTFVDTPPKGFEEKVDPPKN
ncbi:MAG TPA: hypothetical protein VF865_01730 [Acidobacteriaceae bacterium]